MFGIRVTIIDRNGAATEHQFERFPVRIGRNALNDVRLDLPYISQFHALLWLDQTGTQIEILDLGSRNGTVLSGVGLIVPNTPVNLASSNNEFKIWETTFRVARVDISEPRISLRRGGVHDLAEGMTRPNGIAIGPALTDRVKPLYDAYREAWTRVYEEIQRKVAPCSDELRAKLCDELRTALPQLEHEPDFQRLAGRPSVKLPQPSPANADAPAEATDLSRSEAVALHGLKQLASWYMPSSPPPRSAEDVVGFLQSMQDTLDVFFRCFIPLRDGYKQFEAQMDIRRGRSDELPSKVETARDPPELARVMLDWRGPKSDEAQAIANTFAELMTHQVAMLSGIMKGVKSLLDELAPATLEQEIDKPGRNRQGLHIGPFRFKQLWELYAERHADLSTEDKRTFALIFGPQFARAYAQFTGVPGMANVTPGAAEAALRSSNATLPPLGPAGPNLPEPPQR